MLRVASLGQWLLSLYGDVSWLASLVGRPCHSLQPRQLFDPRVLLHHLQQQQQPKVGTYDQRSKEGRPPPLPPSPADPPCSALPACLCFACQSSSSGSSSSALEQLLVEAVLSPFRSHLPLLFPHAPPSASLDDLVFAPPPPPPTPLPLPQQPLPAMPRPAVASSPSGEGGGGREGEETGPVDEERVRKAIQDLDQHEQQQEAQQQATTGEQAGRQAGSQPAIVVVISCGR